MYRPYKKGDIDDTKILQICLSLNRFRQVIMGTPAAIHRNITPVSASSQDEEVMIVVTPRKNYYLTKREAGKFHVTNSRDLPIYEC